MNDDLKLALQIGAPFVASLIYSAVSWFAHRPSRSQVAEIHKVVTNGYALRAELKDHGSYGHVEPRR